VVQVSHTKRALPSPALPCHAMPSPALLGRAHPALSPGALLCPLELDPALLCQVMLCSAPACPGRARALLYLACNCGASLDTELDWEHVGISEQARCIDIDVAGALCFVRGKRVHVCCMVMMMA